MARTQAHLISRLESLKAETGTKVTELYKILQKPALFNGFTKTYHPLGDRPEDTLPPERTNVQHKVRDVLEEFAAAKTALIDAVYQIDVGNTKAFADVIVSGKMMLPQVPVTNLLFLLKHLQDVQTALKAVPTPSADVMWGYDEAQDVMRSTQPTITQRTSKTPTRFEKAPATNQHPAQVDVIYVDKVIGEWRKDEFTGCEAASRKLAALDKVAAWIVGVRDAIETANASVTADTTTIAKTIFDDIMSPIRAPKK